MMVLFWRFFSSRREEMDWATPTDVPRMFLTWSSEYPRFVRL